MKKKMWRVSFSLEKGWVSYSHLPREENVPQAQTSTMFATHSPFTIDPRLSTVLPSNPHL